MSILTPEERKALQLVSMRDHVATIDECITVVEAAVYNGSDPVEYLKAFRKVLSDKVEAYANAG